MKLFTPQERNLILVLIVLLVVGLIGIFVKKQVFDESSDTLKLVGVSEEIESIYSEIKHSSSDSISNSLININNADETEIVSLPGIGPVLANRIIEKRKELGGFKTNDDILKVSGIGPKVLSKLIPHITLD